MALESWCKHHPRSEVWLYISPCSKVFDGIVHGLRDRGCPVTMLHFDAQTFFKDTPLDRFVTAKRIQELQSSESWGEHQMAMFRLAAPWRFGGFVLDPDVLLLRPVDGFSNALESMSVSPDELRLSNAVSVFDAGSPFLEHAMRLFATSYNLTDRAIAGPTFLSNAYRTWPHTECAEAQCVNQMPRGTVTPSEPSQSQELYEAGPVASRGALETSHILRLGDSATSVKPLLEGSVLSDAYKANCVLCTLLEPGKNGK